MPDRDVMKEVIRKQHQEMVLYLVEYLKRKGWKVTHASAIDGFAEPKTVVNYKPDIKAFHGVFGVTGYGEVETCDTVSSEDTRNRLEELSIRHMKSNKKPVKVFIIVPSECYAKLEELMQQPALGNRGNIALLKYG